MFISAEQTEGNHSCLVTQPINEPEIQRNLDWSCHLCDFRLTTNLTEPQETQSSVFPKVYS